MSIGRKFKRKSEMERRRYDADVRRDALKLSREAMGAADKMYIDELERQTRNATDIAIIKTAAVAAEVIFRYWAKLNKKETRIEKFVELYLDHISRYMGTGTSEREQAEKLLKEKYGVTFSLED